MLLSASLESSEINVKYGVNNMSIGSVGSSGSNPYGSSAGGMSAEQADAGLEAAEAKKRADGVKNAWKTAVNQNTAGIKTASDALRL
jgi:hypothetical protein